MNPNVLWILLVITVCSGYITAAPSPNSLANENRQELINKFAEFLHQDSEFSKIIQAAEWNDEGFARQRRQANVQALDSDEMEPQKDKKGFFDRAAKFVTEMLQRFLKWINSAENE